MRHNPLVAPILHILRRAPASLSEYELIREIENQGQVIDVVADNPQHALFRKHFLVMNALYKLQTDLLNEGVYLQISAMQIALHAGGASSASRDLSEQGERKLRDYYLDWRNYQETSADEVSNLLASFWQRYAAQDKRQPALQVLGLAADADWSSVRASYRRLAHQYHPDKGGNDEKFIEVREAYEILRCCFENIR